MENRSTSSTLGASSRKALGQYMTPQHVAHFLAEQLPANLQAVCDLAAGDCALLSAVKARVPTAKACGFELDSEIYELSQNALPSATLVNADGLIGSLEELALPAERLAVVGNPPFTELEPTDAIRQIAKEAFPTVSGKLGYKRSELYFLARSLLIAKAARGFAAVVMPVGFADGDIYSQYRKALMSGYAVLSAIEFPAQTFTATEARTVLLVVDTSDTRTRNIEISRYDAQHRKAIPVFRGELAPGERLDARYHEGRMSVPPNVPTIGDIGVTIVRGRVSRKEAELLKLDVVHTSNLRNAHHGALCLPEANANRRDSSNGADPVIAQPGDILLPRTGSRVSWTPVIVQSGARAITDHVFRIRAPKHSRSVVLASFRHPNFTRWLESVSKGVCATVLTKRELLSMPLFSEVA